MSGRNTRSSGRSNPLTEEQIPKNLRPHNKSPVRRAAETQEEEQPVPQVPEGADGGVEAVAPQPQPGREEEPETEESFQDAEAEGAEIPPLASESDSESEDEDEESEDEDEDEGDMTEGDAAGAAAAMVQQLQAQAKELEDLKAQLQLVSNTKLSNDAKPPNFSGSREERSAEIWISKMDSLAAQFKWPDAKYIEVAVSAMTKEAEKWAQLRRFENSVGMSTTWQTKDNFRKDFLAFFQDNRTQVERLATWTTVKQKQDESVRSFWIRVDTANNDFIKQHLINEGWDLPAAEAGVTKQEDTELVRTEDAEADEEENEKRIKERIRQEAIKALVKFANDKLRDIFFFQGLKPAIRDQLSTKLDELGKLKVSILEAATNAESVMGASKTVSAITSELEVAASNWGPSRGGSSRGRGGFRGGRGGGRGGSQQPSSQQQSTPPGLNKLRKIQSRQKALHCNRCYQWGKHFTNECRRPWSQIASMDFQDENNPPSVVSDPFFDGLNEMPPKPKDDPEQGN